MKNKNYLSFFSGALGLDLGLEKAGLEPLAYNEFNPKIYGTIKKNRPEISLITESILDLSKDKIFEIANLKEDTEIFLMAGGPPCQPFSTNGKRLSFLDERGNALVKYLQLILEIKPKYFILENVRGMLSAALIKEDGTNDKPGTVLKYILEQFNNSGYSLNFNLYDTSLYGVPQKRERFVLIGCLGEEKVPSVRPSGKKVKTVKEAFSKLNDEKMEYTEYSKAQLEVFKKIPMGGNWRDLSKKDQEKYMGGSLDSSGGRTGYFRRLNWDKAAPTLVTSPKMKSTGLCHPVLDRPLSIEEYAALQTFPKSWKFVGSTNDKYVQIGNAVPVEFAYALAKHILEFDKGQKILEPIKKLSRYNNTLMKDWLKFYNFSE